MPTPPKPFTVLSNEKKSHRTQAELNQRKHAEKALATGTALKERSEVKSNSIAHKEFIRINKLLKNIEKNDAIYESVINRYCIIQSECFGFEEKREKFYTHICDFEEKYLDMVNRKEITQADYYKIQSQMQKNLIDLDKQVQSKRKMLLDIEKENIMTIAAALRSIPKKVENKTNALLDALGGG